MEYPDRQEAFWGYRDVALVASVTFVCYFGLSLIGAILLKTFPALKHHEAALIVPLQFFTYGAVYLGLSFTFVSRHGRPTLESLAWRRSRISLWIPILSGLALPFVLSAILAPFHPPTVSTPFDKFFTSRIWLGVLGVIAVTIGPWMEELLFRGFLQPLLSRSLGILAGVALTGVLFGLLHAPEYQFAWQYAAAVSLAGVAFGAIRAWSGSTIASTFMHGAFNLVMFCGMLAKGKF